MSVEAMKKALDVLVHVTTLPSKKARDSHAKAVSGLREAIATAEKNRSRYELTFDFPRQLEHPLKRLNLTAAYLFEYWGNKGVIPRYDGVIDGLRAGATEISRAAKPRTSSYESNPHTAKEAVVANTIDKTSVRPLLAEKDALLRQALEALEGFIHITNDSQGVAGYHLSGDTAEWDEFDEADAAISAIEAIRQNLGVKND